MQPPVPGLMSGDSLRAASAETLLPTYAPTAREAAAELSAQRLNKPDPASMAFELAGGPMLGRAVKPGLTLASKPPLIGGYRGTGVPEQLIDPKFADLGTHMAVDPAVANLHAFMVRDSIPMSQLNPRVSPVVADVNNAFKFPTDPQNWNDPTSVTLALYNSAKRGAHIPKGLLGDIERIEAQPGGWNKNFIPAMQERGFDAIHYPHQVMGPLGSRYGREPAPGNYSSFMLFDDKQMLPRFSEEGQALIKERGIKEPLKKDPWVDEVYNYHLQGKVSPVGDRTKYPNREVWKPPKGILQPYDEMVPGRGMLSEIDRVGQEMTDKIIAEHIKKQGFEDAWREARKAAALKANPNAFDPHNSTFQEIEDAIKGFTIRDPAVMSEFNRLSLEKARAGQ